MMDLLLLYITFFLMGWLFREKLAKFRVYRFYKQNQQQVEEKVTIITINKLHDIFYIYEKDTGAFIMQVKSREEMFELFKNNAKYSGTAVMMSKEDYKMFDAS